MVNQLNFKEIMEARDRIRNYVNQTPLVLSNNLSDNRINYFFKLECLQPVRAFKIRGALNKMLTLTEEERNRGVAAISSGNHGASVSFASRLLGIEKAVVIVPETTPRSKVDKIKSYGGQVNLMGKNYDEAHKLGMEFIEKQEMTMIDSYYEDVKVYAGQGTAALEILEQNPKIDTILTPVGGGGLLTGTAVAAKGINPDIRVIGVQTAACPAMIKAYEDNVFYEQYPNEPSICDALVGGIGKLSYEMAKDYVDDLIAVEEDSIKRAVSFMVKAEKIVVEPASAVCTAAVMDFRKRIGGNNVALVMSGGNIDSDLLVSLLNDY